MSVQGISVLSVSWQSIPLLKQLFTNLLAYADYPEQLNFFVADNTNGHDPAVSQLDIPNLTVLPVDVRGERMSMAHAAGLNALLPLVETPYTLVIDPDVAVFYAGWDTVLRELVAPPDLVTAGAPYPPWKIGVYHDFPSPPFAFWQTGALQSLNANWQPYDRTSVRRVLDFARRQMFWLPRIIDRWILRLPRRQFKTAWWMERVVGVASKDTGWRIAHVARDRGWKAALFEIVYDADTLMAITDEQRTAYQELARDFELFAWEGVPFLSHRNPTLTQISFNLWTSNNVTLYQNRADKEAKTARWRELVEALLGDDITFSQKV